MKTYVPGDLVRIRSIGDMKRDDEIRSKDFIWYSDDGILRGIYGISVSSIYDIRNEHSVLRVTDADDISVRLEDEQTGEYIPYFWHNLMLEDIVGFEATGGSEIDSFLESINGRVQKEAEASEDKTIAEV